MAYKLPKEDQLCGVVYNTYTGYKPIPKATCPANSGGCGDNIKAVLNWGKEPKQNALPEYYTDGTIRAYVQEKAGHNDHPVHFKSDTPMANPLVIDPKQFTRSNDQPGNLYKDFIQANGYTHVKAGGGQFTQLNPDGTFSVSYESVDNKVAIVEFGRID